MNKAVNIDQSVKSKAKSGKKISSLVMAPAILANGKSSENKNSKLSSKQNMKKMDPENRDSEDKRTLVDLAALKTQLSSEDHFISSLLTNIPTQGISTVQDLDGNEINLDANATKVMDTGSRATNPEELKERLAAKLSQFKGKKLDFSDKKMKTKLKRKLDKLEKKKLKRKNNKMKSKIAKLAQVTKAATASLVSPSTETVKIEAPEPTVQISRPPKPIFNSEGRMVFSKFDFGELTTPSPIQKKMTLDPKAALVKIKKVKEKVKHLEGKGEVEKARSIEEKRAWEGALQRAEGVKVKDNVELLAKSIKKREKQKLQSKKKWNERVEAQEKKQEEQQKKRKANISKKKTEKKEKKLNRLAKKGKFIV